MLVVQHIFFTIMDHLAPLIRKELLDSCVGRNFTCVKTKTAVVANRIRDNFFDELKERMTQSPFGIMFHGSNDIGLQKLYRVTVLVFDGNFNHIMTKFFNMNWLEGTDASIAASMLDSRNNFFEQYNIQWDHCMGIGLENMNANIGEWNSIASHVCQKNNITITSCPCHILHNASSKASEKTFNKNNTQQHNWFWNI